MKKSISAWILAMILVTIIGLLSSCSQYGFIEIKSPNEAWINQGGDVRVIYNPIYKDSVEVGKEVKFKCKKIYKND